MEVAHNIIPNFAAIRLEEEKITKHTIKTPKNIETTCFFINSILIYFFT